MKPSGVSCSPDTKLDSKQQVLHCLKTGSTPDADELRFRELCGQHYEGASKQSEALNISRSVCVSQSWQQASTNQIKSSKASDLSNQSNQSRRC